MCEFGQIICEFVSSLEKWGLYHIGEDFNKWKYIAIDIKIWEGIKIRIVYMLGTNRVNLAQEASLRHLILWKELWVESQESTRQTWIWIPSSTT